MKPKPVCESLFPWLRANYGPRCLAPLTGTDTRALRAAVQIIDLYCYDRQPEVLVAFRAVVMQMQPQCRHFAFNAIAHVMDWGDRDVIWHHAGMERPAFVPRSLLRTYPQPVPAAS